MIKAVRILILLIVVLVVVFMFGPRAPEPIYQPVVEEVPLIQELDEVEVSTTEKPIRPGNQARIIWADTPGVKTPWSLVYLHGFGASPEEGSPVHKRLAKNFGMNLYLARLQDHGLVTEEPLLNMTPEGLIASAREAIAVGQALGDQVVVMGLSTGGTCALYLAAHNPKLVDALLLYSPNIRVSDPRAAIVTQPWGLQMTRMIAGGKYRYWEGMPLAAEPFWYRKQRAEAVIALQKLLETTMTAETFQAVKQPVLLTYYYKNEEFQDNLVSVPAMREMYGQLGTQINEKWDRPLTIAGHHILCSPIFSFDTETPYEVGRDFLEEVVGIESKY